MRTSRLPVIALGALLTACSSTRTTPGRPAPEGSSRTIPVASGRGNSESVHQLGVPPGHLPRAGQCRVWVPGTPPGRQQRARSCAGILAVAPRGSWILYRPTSDRRHVRVQVVDADAPRVVVVRIFEVESGRFVKEEAPSDDDDHGDDRDDRGRGRGRRPSN